MTAAPLLAVRRLGVVQYEAALELQRELVRQRQQGQISDTLLLLSHPAVFTLGRRRTASANVLMPGNVPVVQVERGGDVTFHGPGQLVGYPILQLAESERDLHELLRRLEEALIAVLGELGLRGERKPGFTGVWCQGRKLVSLGVAVDRWVSWHGFALNVTTDLACFRRINPCGLSAEIMGSVESCGGRTPPTQVIEDHAASAIARAFGRTLVVGP